MDIYFMVLGFLWAINSYKWVALSSKWSLLTVVPVWHNVFAMIKSQSLMYFKNIHIVLWKYAIECKMKKAKYNLFSHLHF